MESTTRKSCVCLYQPRWYNKCETVAKLLETTPYFLQGDWFKIDDKNEI
jgi:hypothetical protein